MTSNGGEEEPTELGTSRDNELASGDSITTSRRYRIRVDGDGLTLDIHVGSALAGSILQLAMGGGSATPAASPQGGIAREIAPSTVAPPQPPAGRPELTLGEYLAESEAKTNVDKITAVGEYLAEHSNQPNFTLDDVRAQLLAIREDVPKNLHRDMASAAKARYIAEDTSSKGSYYVTGTGRTAIAGQFPRQPRKRARPKKTSGG